METQSYLLLLVDYLSPSGQLWSYECSAWGRPGGCSVGGISDPGSKLSSCPAGVAPLCCSTGPTGRDQDATAHLERPWKKVEEVSTSWPTLGDVTPPRTASEEQTGRPETGKVPGLGLNTCRRRIKLSNQTSCWG